MQSESVIIERTYNTTAEKVWKAITDINQLRQWYFDLSDFKPELGFEFRFEGKNEGRVFVHLCKVTAIVPGKKLQYSWSYEGHEGYSLVTFELFAEGSSTRVKLTHEGLETFPMNNPDFARTSFEKGWTAIIGTSLKEYVEKLTV